MPKPTIIGMHKITYILEDDSKIQIVSLKGGKSYQTITFPQGTLIEVYVSKLPMEENKSADV